MSGREGKENRPRRVEVPIFDPETMRRRRALRTRADAIQREMGDARFLEWFDRLYAEANGDPAGIPWANLKPHPLLSEWLERNAPHKGRALEVGCGLGDNAAALARAGYQVTAFDISPHAVKWAQARHPDLAVDWQVADLLEPPPDWSGTFELVHETYTLQSLPLSLRAQAVANLPGFLRPGGRLLLICRVRLEESEPSGPPWPLASSELRPLAEAGLKLVENEFVTVVADREIPHLFSLWQKPA